MAEYISFQPSDFFSTTLYTGDGTSANAITGVGFQPDLVWNKPRDTDGWHRTFDSVRGVLNVTYPNDTYYNEVMPSPGGLNSFDSDGYTMGTNTGSNENTKLFVSWNWKAGTTTGIAGSPSITPSSYSFNATSGFSIIKYVGNGTLGATIPHGLGVAPDMVITKNLDIAEGWAVYHTFLGPTKFLKLNVDTAVGTGTGYWNDTAPSATLVTLGDDGGVNQSTKNMVAYCFTNKTGYSKFGNYWGNGQTSDGTFVYTGFRPSFILIKRTGISGNWQIFDDKRLGYNGGNSYLSPNDNAVENTGGQIDIVSNGFKMRNNGTYTNGSGDTYLYAAFAESPIVSSNDIPVIAR